MSATRIVDVTAARLDDAAGALAAAFSDYPVFTYVLPYGTGERDAKLHAVMRYYAWRRLVRGWPLRAVEANGELIAVIAANPPHDGTPPPGVEMEEARLVRMIGADAEARRKHYESVSGDPPAVSHYFIGMIGVRPAARGQGHARRLMREIHALSDAHAESRGVALCTESEDNLGFYATLGYEITSSVEIDGLRSWSLWRARNA